MNTPISYEFFPPKTDAGAKKLLKVAAQLAKNNPEYFSVTFGAGGSTEQGTFQTVQNLRQATEIQIAPHLSCISASAEQLQTILDQYQQQHVEHIVALRGDRPSGMGAGSGDFKFGVDLVEFIRKNGGDNIHLSVGAYPEAHPESANLMDEIKYFKQKVEAGANSAITQYFYNADAYFNFCDLCQKEQINIPIIPGIMPIYNLANLERFSKLCGAQIPRWLHQSLLSCKDQASVQQLGIDFVSSLCESLIAGGAPALHFYTLNQLDVCQSITNNLT